MKRAEVCYSSAHYILLNEGAGMFEKLYKQLIEAIKAGKLSQVKILWDYLHGEERISFKELNITNPLFYAVIGNHLDIIKFLLTEATPKAEMQGFYQQDAAHVLSIAAQFSELNTFKFLLSILPGSNLFYRDKITGRSLLHFAACSGKTDVARFLLTNYPKHFSVDMPDEHRQDTPLSLAAWKLQFDMVGYLLRHGATIDIKLSNGRTPREELLSLESQNKKKRDEMAVLLKDSETLLEIAEGIKKAEYEIVGIEVTESLLLRVLGNGINAKRIQDGNTALHLAFKRAHLSKRFIKKLLTVQPIMPDINIQNNEGDTPMHCLLQRSDVPKDILYFILNLNPNLELKNKKGISVSQMLATLNDPYVKAMLYRRNIKQLIEALSEKTKPEPTVNLKKQVMEYKEVKESKDTKEVKELKGAEEKAAKEKQDVLQLKQALKLEIRTAIEHLASITDKSLRSTLSYSLVMTLLKHFDKEESWKTVIYTLLKNVIETDPNYATAKALLDRYQTTTARPILYQATQGQQSQQAQTQAQTTENTENKENKESEQDLDCKHANNV